jgi:hypothetical protein
MLTCSLDNQKERSRSHKKKRAMCNIKDTSGMLAFMLLIGSFAVMAQCKHTLHILKLMFVFVYFYIIYFYVSLCNTIGARKNVIQPIESMEEEFGSKLASTHCIDIKCGGNSKQTCYQSHSKDGGTIWSIIMQCVRHCQ